MRISDWSSDVCSSVLHAKQIVQCKACERHGGHTGHWHRNDRQARHETRDEQNADAALEKERFRSPHATVLRQREPAQQAQPAKSVAPPGDVTDRAEERRGGKECVRTCRYRGSPDHTNKNKRT